MFYLDTLTPMVSLRFMCGFFLIPHAIGKLTAQEAAFGFFSAAGFKPPAFYAYAAMTIELIVATLLMTGFFVQVAAWIACGYLLIATIAVIRVNRRWLWHIGGCEYPFFLALCCAIVGWSAGR